MEVCPYSYFRWCGYFRGPWVSFVTTVEFSVRVTKITSSIGVSWTHSLPFCSWLIFNSMNYGHIIKGSKPGNFEKHNSLKLSFTNIWGFRSNFPGIKLSWQSCSMWEKLGWLNWFWQFLCEGLSSFNSKTFYYTYAWSCSLCKRKASFSTGLISRKLWGSLLMFSITFTSLTVLLLFPLLITFFVAMHGFWFYFI